MSKYKNWTNMWNSQVENSNKWFLEERIEQARKSLQVCHFEAKKDKDLSKYTKWSSWESEIELKNGNKIKSCERERESTTVEL